MITFDFYFILLIMFLTQLINQFVQSKCNSYASIVCLLHINNSYASIVRLLHINRVPPEW